MFDLFMAICFSIAASLFIVMMSVSIIYLFLFGIACFFLFLVLILPGVIVKTIYDGLKKIGCNAGKNRSK